MPALVPRPLSLQQSSSMINGSLTIGGCAEGAVANLVKVLGKADAKLIDCSEAGIIIFLTWFFLSWKQELSEVAIVMERKLKVGRPACCRQWQYLHGLGFVG